MALLPSEMYRNRRTESTAFTQEGGPEWPRNFLLRIARFGGVVTIKSPKGGGDVVTNPQ